jgi:lipopolysaccharide exporter
VSLAQRTTSSVKWSFASQGFRLFMRFITLVVLTRFIPPSDFGLMSMALVVTVFVDLFRDLGTSAAIIQRKQATQRLLSTLFWANVVFGAVAALVTFLVAPLVADFYASPSLTDVVRVMALSFLLSGVGMVHQALLARRLSFRRLAKVEIAAAVAGSVTAVIVAAAGGGVYCLVGLLLVTSGVNSVGAWITSKWRPSFTFALDDIRAVRRFTTNLVGFNLVNYFARNMDYVLIGRFLGAQALGYYTLAYNLLLFPLQMVSDSFARVMFPAYSAIQDDRARIGRTYLRVAAFIASVTFPMMTGLLVLCDVFVDVVYGPSWSPAVPVIAVLAPIGMFQSIATVVGGIYQSQGRTDLQLKVGLVFTALVVVSFAIGLHWGIVGVAAGYAVANLLIAYPASAIPLGLVGLRFTDLLRVLARPFAASVLMAAVLLAARFALPHELGALALALLVLLGACAYLAACAIVNRQLLSDARRFVIQFDRLESA